MDCMLQGALRETQARSINHCCVFWIVLGWSELRFIAFPCLQAKTWFHMVPSCYINLESFWHLLTLFHPGGWSLDGLDFRMVVFHRYCFDFSYISSWRCRTWVSNSFVALTTYTTKELWPQTKHGADKSETILEGAIRFWVSGTFIISSIFILIMFFTHDIATISDNNIESIESSLLLLSTTCCADTCQCCQMG